MVRIEGIPGKIEAQLWLSAFGLPQPQLDSFAIAGGAVSARNLRGIKLSGQKSQTAFE
jgi:hypothetical protein